MYSFSQQLIEVFHRQLVLISGRMGASIALSVNKRLAPKDLIRGELISISYVAICNPRYSYDHVPHYFHSLSLAVFICTYGLLQRHFLRHVHASRVFLKNTYMH